MRPTHVSALASAALLLTACAAAAPTSPGAAGADATPSTAPAGAAPGATTSAPPAATPGAAATSRGPASYDASHLVGSWNVTGAPGQAGGSVLQLSTDISLWSGCGMLQGSWRADTSGVLLTTIYSATGSCVAQLTDPAHVTWLAGVHRYVPDGAGWQLVGSDGAVLAHLTPGGHPTPGPDTLPSLADTPVLTPTLRDWLSPGRPVRAGLRPVTAQDLVGTWISAQLPATVTVPSRSPSATAAPQAPAVAFIRFTSDGTFVSSDGCNGGRGRWAVSDGGGVVMTDSGPNGLVGCMNSDGPPIIDVDLPFYQAVRAGFDGEVLVLLSRTGREIARVRRG